MSGGAATFRKQGSDPLGQDRFADGLLALYAWTAAERARCEVELSALSQGQSLNERGARHLLDLGGKRLRPLCVVLAAKLGNGFGDAACDLAVSAELIHSATLLHDDVIDVGDVRRGAPTARVIFGNSASVLAGDGLLVAALQRIVRAGDPVLLDRALETLAQMIAAEAQQLEQRGRMDADRDACMRVIEGKTASLFRWALYSGAKIGGLSSRRCGALESFGRHLGIAFQLVDDVLDVAGNANTTGKALFADLREGRMTFPMLVALEREPALRETIKAWLEPPEQGRPPGRLGARVLDVLGRTGAVRDTLALARSHSEQAVASLDALSDGPGRQALTTLADAAVDRRR